MNILSPEEQAAKNNAKEIKRLRIAGKLTEALRMGEEYIAASGDHPRVLCSMGEVYKKQRDLPKAREYFERTLKINPNNEVARLLLGKTFLQEQDYPQAVAQFYKNLRTQFHWPTVKVLRLLASHDVGKRQYDMLLEAAAAQGQISGEEKGRLFTPGNAGLLTSQAMEEIGAEIGNYVRSKIFQRDGRLPVPINRDAFHVAHNRPTSREMEERGTGGRF